MIADGIWPVSFGRTAVPADPAWIRAMLPPGVVGAYILLDGSSPFYVGRSDSCLAGRLVHHEYLAEASHVFWEVCRDSVRAFHCESFWYDRSGGSHRLRNRIHPARPAGHSGGCPFCSIRAADLRTLLANLPRKNRRRR